MVACLSVLNDFRHWRLARFAPSQYDIRQPGRWTPQVWCLRRLPAEGYSVRGQGLPDGRYLLAWVKAVSGSNHDCFYRILEGFGFGGFEQVSPQMFQD